jgi:Fe2+ transport system protein B
MIHAILPFLTAIALSAIAAYYSVIGLAQIFPGSYWPIIIMGSVLEAAKLVTVSWVYNNWKTTFSALKVYFLIAVVLLMAITSMGIFGYLSKAHIEHSSSIAPLIEKEMIYEEKIQTLKENIQTNRKNVLQLDAAVDQVMARSADERGAERSNQIRKAQQKERTRASDEIARSQAEIQKITEEKSPISLEIKKAESDLGPIKYVADVVYGKQDRDLIDRAVRLVIFVIIVVFDPLAVLLLIASNQTYRRLKGETQIEVKKVVKKKKIDKKDGPSLESFFVDDKHQVIPKDKIADMNGDMNERS